MLGIGMGTERWSKGRIRNSKNGLLREFISDIVVYLESELYVTWQLHDIGIPLYFEVLVQG